MSNVNGKNEVSAFAAVLADMRTNQTKQETAIGKMIAAVYSMEAAFDAVVIKRYFAEEAAKRKEMQDHILEGEDDTFAKELKFLDAEMDKDKRDRDVIEVENVKRRHNYLRGEFHKAMTALAFLRLGGEIDGNTVGAIVKLVSPRGKDAGRFFISWKEDDEIVRSQVSYSSRALINAGTRTLTNLKLKKVSPNAGNVKGSSVGATAKAAANAFETSVNLLLQKQTEVMQKIDPKANATVHDLPDEAEADVMNTAKMIARLLWAHDGKIDLVDVEGSLKQMGFTVGYVPRRKTA